MDLFNNEIDSLTNLLPQDGIVNYYKNLLSLNEANFYFNSLLHSIEWKNDQALIYGKLIITDLKYALLFKKVII